MSQIAILENQIRDIFKIPSMYRNTINNVSNFNQAWSALDVIGDTELALTEFQSYNPLSNKGLSYIFAYGVLQAIFLQQDAIKNLAMSLKIPVELPDKLREIRELRNDATGHPTDRDVDRNKKLKSFHHISRESLSNKGFDLISTYSDNDQCNIKYVDFETVIGIQSEFCENILKNIIEELKKAENTHRRKFMDDKLSYCFPSTLSYNFSTVKEGIRKDTDKDKDLALTIFKVIMEAVSKFSIKLKDRGEDESIGYGPMIKELDYPMEKVLQYLKGIEDVDSRAVEIFIYYIEEKVNKLKQIADEIDKNYEEKM